MGRCHSVIVLVAQVWSIFSSIYRTSNSQKFALTSSVCRLVESVGGCVEMNESLLLVGETGSGKTAAVQFIASYLGTISVVFLFKIIFTSGHWSQIKVVRTYVISKNSRQKSHVISGRKLHVVNMSQQSESADLLGG